MFLINRLTLWTRTPVFRAQWRLNISWKPGILVVASPKDTRTRIVVLFKFIGWFWWVIAHLNHHDHESRTARVNSIKIQHMAKRKDCYVRLEAHLVICISSLEQDKWNAPVHLGDNGQVNSELISPHWYEWFTVGTVTGYLHPSDNWINTIIFNLIKERHL